MSFSVSSFGKPLFSPSIMAAAGRARAQTPRREHNITPHYLPMRYNTILLLLLLLTERTPSHSRCRLHAYFPPAGARDSRQFDAEPRVSLLAHRASYGVKYPKSIMLLTTNHYAGRPRFRNRESIVVFENDKLAGKVRQEQKIIS